MSKKCSDQFYYAVRIGWKPGIYRGWYGEYGAKKQIAGIRNYDYSTGYLKTSSWEDADAYMRAHELFSVESDFTIKKVTPFNEDMSVVHGGTHVAAKETPAQPPAAPATENAFFPPSAPSVPYHRDEKLESFLHAYYPDRRFTDDQKAAIQALSGAHLLYAIPGSGKTAVLTARAGWMIYCGIPAENILIMTFGKKAAEHMADVFRERFPSFSVPFFCTIHSFSYRIIRQAEAEGLIKKYRLIVDEEDDPVPEAMDDEAVNAWIVDESPDEVPSGRTKREDKKKGNRYANPRSPIYLLEKILTRLEYCKKQSEARTFAEQAATVIGCLKNRRMTDEEIRRLSPIDMGADEPVSIWSVYEAYQKELTEHQPPEMDFDDMLIHALEVLDNPNMQAFWQRKYPYVCVDEAQDTSRLQHAIVQKLHRTGDSLFMVGDDDQSIYAFRGAMPEDMLTFDRRYEDAAVHRMGVNFRSDQQIVLSGDGLIQRNEERAKKTMEAFSKQPGEIRIIDISAARQGQFLLDQARRFCKKQEGEENPESLAILYRNNVSALLPLAYFFKNDVPFVCNKVFDILTLLYSRTAINILAFLCFVLEPDSFQAYSSAYPVWNHYHGLFLNRETAVENLQKQMGGENSGGPILPKLQALLRSLGEMDKARHIGEIWTILQRIQPHAGIQR
ncbi:MAG: UvrD-helicase domain-containing protein [Christensenellales bacterium]|nr:UvrD-helicase domain-containing protein [Christensenellales bacterium]